MKFFLKPVEVDAIQLTDGIPEAGIQAGYWLVSYPDGEQEFLTNDEFQQFFEEKKPAPSAFDTEALKKLFPPGSVPGSLGNPFKLPAAQDDLSWFWNGARSAAPIAAFSVDNATHSDAPDTDTPTTQADKKWFNMVSEGRDKDQDVFRNSWGVILREDFPDRSILIWSDIKGRWVTYARPEDLDLAKFTGSS